MTPQVSWQIDFVTTITELMHNKSIMAAIKPSTCLTVNHSRHFSRVWERRMNDT